MVTQSVLFSSLIRGAAFSGADSDLIPLFCLTTAADRPIFQLTFFTGGGKLCGLCIRFGVAFCLSACEPRCAEQDIRFTAGSGRKQTGGFGDIDPGKLPFVHYLSDRSFPLRLLYARHYRLLPMDIMSHRSIRHRHHPGHPQPAARRRHIRHNEHVRHHSAVLVIQDVAVHHELADVAVIS